jgi:hypothetical protein
MVNVEFNDRRAPQSNPTVPAVLPEGHPDTFLLNPYAYIKDTDPAAKFLTSASPFRSTQGDKYSSQGGQDNSISDILNLTSIESVQWVEKYDKAKNLTYSLVLKIKNTSISPADTVGVIAQIAVK